MTRLSVIASISHMLLKVRSYSKVMTQYRIHAVLLTVLLGDALLLAAPTPTFSKDVAPILQRSCQECHRPGEIGPFPLLTYEQARPWAAAIKASVVQKKMPPWFADPHYGRFRNDRSLPQKDIDTLVSWASGGAPKGDPKDLPAPASFTNGWEIPEPDVVFEMPEPYQIPATGTLEYLHWLIPTLLPGPAHGHAIAKCIERGFEESLQVEPGSLYHALHRLLEKGCAASSEGTSENNRRAEFPPVNRIRSEATPDRNDEMGQTDAGHRSILGPLSERGRS
jgi:hypothetical protein